MTALLPRLFGDVSDWFDTEFPLRMAHLIRIEDSLSEQEYTLRAEIPGLDPEKNVQIKVSNGLLMIHAERSERERTANRSEFRYGVLQRTIRLPANADEEKITAKYENGILEVAVPLTAAEPTGREIPIANPNK